MSANSIYSQIIQDCTSNPIRVENCLQGTLDWQIPLGDGLHPIYKPSLNHEVEGYASKTSVNAGETVGFHIRTHRTAQVVNIDIYRLGYYAGNGARYIASTSVGPTVTYNNPLPQINLQTGLAESYWEQGASWAVPSNAVSGFYLARLTGSITKHQSYISFVVRNDSYNSPVLFQTAVTTHQAYNNYPGWVDCATNEPFPCDLESRGRPANGKALYNDISGGPPLPGIPANGTRQARKVSFNRPFNITTSFGIFDTAGISFFNYEYPMIRWLEKEGYNVTYVTDLDTHNDPKLSPIILQPGKHKVLLSVGHDEYWSWEMRDNIEQARNHPTQPLNIAFFGGNISYWQIRTENSSPTGTYPSNSPNRTMVCYKETARGEVAAARDPYVDDGNSSNDYLITDLWRRNTIKPPEDELIGVMTIPPDGDATHLPTPANGYLPIYCCSSNHAELVATAPNWLKAGTSGGKLYNLIGYESDELYNPGDNYPNHNPTIVVASAPFYALRGKVNVLLGTAETTFYTLQSNGAKVFAASGQQWSWGLDDWGADGSVGPVIALRQASMSADAQKITKNILDCFSTYASCGN